MANFSSFIHTSNFVVHFCIAFSNCISDNFHFLFSTMWTITETYYLENMLIQDFKVDTANEQGMNTSNLQFYFCTFLVFKIGKINVYNHVNNYWRVTSKSGWHQISKYIKMANFSSFIHTSNFVVHFCVAFSNCISDIFSFLVLRYVDNYWNFLSWKAS